MENITLDAEKTGPNSYGVPAPKRRGRAGKIANFVAAAAILTVTADIGIAAFQPFKADCPAATATPFLNANALLYHFTGVSAFGGSGPYPQSVKGEKIRHMTGPLVRKANECYWVPSGVVVKALIPEATQSVPRPKPRDLAHG